LKIPRKNLKRQLELLILSKRKNDFLNTYFTIKLIDRIIIYSQNFLKIHHSKIIQETHFSL